MGIDDGSQVDLSRASGFLQYRRDPLYRQFMVFTLALLRL